MGLDVSRLSLPISILVINCGECFQFKVYTGNVIYKSQAFGAGDPGFKSRQTATLYQVSW